MCVGREVRVLLVLFSWITVLCRGIGVFGSEVARGASTDAACVAHLSYCLPMCPCGFDLGMLQGSENARPISRGIGNSHSAPFAMAIPDGPGAVCLGFFGFVCVSVWKNRRIWMGLCLCVLTGSRGSAARLARAGVTQLDRVNPGQPDNRGPERPLRHAPCHHVCYCVWPFRFSEGVVFGPYRRYSFLMGPRDGHGSKGLPPQAHAMRGDLGVPGLGRIGSTAPVVSVSVERVSLARPPPRPDRMIQDEME